MVAWFHFNERCATKSGNEGSLSRASELLLVTSERRAPQPLIFPHAVPRFPGERLCRSPAGHSKNTAHDLIPLQFIGLARATAGAAACAQNYVALRLPKKKVRTFRELL